jgi:mono/diheme cytochrome c family protein
MERSFRWAGIATLVTVLAALGAIRGHAAQDQASQAPKPEIKNIPTPNVNPASGKEMYIAYCASCHGTTGAGNGPAASALKTAPADLTQLASKNGGKFPYAKVQQAIKGDPNMPSAHGSQQMPVWGPTLWQLSRNNEAQAQLRIRNITDYIATLQKK